MGQYRGEEGVSEVIAAVLLVGITVLAVTIMTAILLSGPQPDEVPHAAIVAGINETGSFALTHEGGDPMREGEYRIYIETKTGSGLENRTGDFTKPAGGVWLVGENITYRGAEMPERVVVTAISGGSETILTEVAFRGGGRVFDPDPEVLEEPGEEEEFINYVIDENVFVYGTILDIIGSTRVIGDGATVVINEGLSLEGSGDVAVSNIYVNGSVTSGGSSSLGSPDTPRKICINGDLTLTGGDRSIYGDIYVNGNFNFKGATIRGKVYVGGDLTLGWGAKFADGAHIYYTGANKTPSGINCDSCTPNAVYPGFAMPALEIPLTKPDDWYDRGNYTMEWPLSKALSNNEKIFVSEGSISTSGSATNVIIIARDGNITISSNEWSVPVTGVFFAPKGKVTFNGGFLKGVVIARDGFFVENGGTTVTFENIDQYISNPEDYPF